MALGQGWDSSSSLSPGTVPKCLLETLRHLIPEPAIVCWACLEFASPQDSGPVLPWMENPAGQGDTAQDWLVSNLNGCPVRLWVEVYSWP